MGRQPCCDKVGLKKGPWTTDEDKKLVNFILTNGQSCWRDLPKRAGLLRCGKSCRLRWTNYLRPDLKRGLLTEDEEQLVIQLHSQLGNRWSKIASHLPGRTDNEIKNHWNTHIKKKLKKMGIDSLTHKPLPSPSPSPSPSPVDDQVQNDQESEANNVQQEELDAEKSPISQLIDDFCIDEVPFIQPHEILTPSTSSSTSFSSSSSSSNSISSFINNNNNNENNNINNQVNDMGFWDDDFMISLDLLLNDYDSDKGLFESDYLTNYSRMVLDEECFKYEQLL